MPITPEDRARQNIDKRLTDAGWLVQDKRATNLSAGRGVAVGEFPLKSGHGEADYRGSILREKFGYPPIGMERVYSTSGRSSAAISR